ncbi:hypothetical protein BM1374166_00994 [Bartonella tribocorum]|uniref:Uncharacterized protein n=1 Tax=Bartonella tribocorum (strain DSM 28219 / CCUG 45778 / CIP 105476 / IBS 506) TaxID=382640 RepID=A9ITL1_BART1|nr:hypothetical protein predicted by Glimmer/Critica [Bartonella tribocorum CIP 105476]CDO48677.1 hypothetical protein BM1374166_00994 [Bartonella tribocorum]
MDSYKIITLKILTLLCFLILYLTYQNQAVQANDQVAALQSRQNSARTLTASGGGGSTGPMTKETLANMSEKEFNAWISNPKNEARFYEIMGADPDEI